jgi:hypothetical protein
VRGNPVSKIPVSRRAARDKVPVREKKLAQYRHEEERSGRRRWAYIAFGRPASAALIGSRVERRPGRGRVITCLVHRGWPW